MMIVYLRLVLFVQSMWLLPQKICSMVSAYFSPTSIKSTNFIMNSLTKNQKMAIEDLELDHFNRLYITGDLSYKDQCLFLHILKTSELDEHYDLTHMVKYFEMEGMLP